MSITFQANSPVGTQMCATFTINDDDIMEPEEIFTVVATGGDFVDGETTTQVSIEDNDGKQSR